LNGLTILDGLPILDATIMIAWYIFYQGTSYVIKHDG